MLRRATLGAAVSLCLLRRSNRDGHVMRTFEMAAAGACMLVEWSDEHEQILGVDGDAVVYVRTPGDIVPMCRALLRNADQRAALGARVQERMTSGHHTYTDRLAEIIDLTFPLHR